MRIANKIGFYRLPLMILGLLLLTGWLGLLMPATASAAISVTITGDGVTNPVTFTQADLEAMEQVQSVYSTINTWPTKKWYVAEGVRLADLLELAEITDDAQIIKITAKDGYSMTFTRKELLDDPRYYYPGLKENDEYLGYIPGSTDGAEEVDTILALRNVENSDDPDYMSGLNAPLLVMGQRYVTEQTNNAFVKYVGTIEVSTATPDIWESPEATPGSGTVDAGTEVALSTSDMDGDNIHYTTDGSDPTIESPMYNWIKKRWWSSRSDDLTTINHTITINESMTIKTIAIGFGKLDSDINTFDYRVVLSTPPDLTADTTDNEVGQAVDISFTDDADWRAAIADIIVDSSYLSGEEYTITAGNINIDAGVFAAAGDYEIAVKADGYTDAEVMQPMEAGPLKGAPSLTADTTDNELGQAVDISFTDDADWRAAITDIIVDSSYLTSEEYTITAGNINIDAGVFITAGDYEIAVKADGYTDAEVIQTMEAGTLKGAPSLTADTTDNELGQAVDISFTDDADWRAAISGITVNSDALRGEEYTITAGNINIDAGVFITAGDYEIAVQADGYTDAQVIQTMEAGTLKGAPSLTADTTGNKLGQAIDISFTDDKDWRAAISGITVNSDALSNEEYTITAGNINIDAGVFTAAGDYKVIVKAEGYVNATVIQIMESAKRTPPELRADTTNNEVGHTVDISFTDDADWQEAITHIIVDDSYLNNYQYTITDGNINIDADVFTAAGDYEIVVVANGYYDAIVIQEIISAEDVVLTITGSGVAEEVTYSLTQLQKMKQYQNVYSAINTWPTKKWYVGEGVSLKDLLDSAGIKRSAGLIEFISEDGYEITLTVDELLSDDRYYFPNLMESGEGDGSGHIPGSPDGAQEVEPILALVSAEGTDDPDYMNDLNALLLMLGQRAVTEQTGNLFIKNLNRIEVIDDEPPQWDIPEADPEGGEVSAGTLVKLSNENMDDDKIYYTTDGSTPTVESPMYNWIASRWWSAREDVLDIINHPIEIDKDTIIKARTIGPGKADSDVIAFEYQVEDENCIIKTIIPDEGGTVSFGDEAAIIIPANALTGDEEVKVKILKILSPPEVPTGMTLVSDVYEFGIGGENSYSFNSNVTIQLAFELGAADSGKVPAIHYYDEDLGQWVDIGGTASGNKITIQADHFTKFAVMAVDKSVATGIIKARQGGSVGLGSEASISIPANAITNTDKIKVKIERLVISPEAPAGFRLVGRVYEFSVEDRTSYSFAKNVTVKLGFSSNAVSVSENPAIYYYDEALDQWIYIGGTAADNVITAEVDHLTRFAVIAAGEEPPQAAVLTDITGHWAMDNINELVALGAVCGYSDGTFKPDNTISRAEFSAILVNAFQLENQGGKTFADTEHHWAKDYIARLTSNGIIGGYNAYTFGPDDMITREQMAVMINRAAQLAPAAAEISFADRSSISAWALEAITAVSREKIMNGYYDNTFRPHANASRAEAVTVIVNALRILKTSSLPIM